MAKGSRRSRPQQKQLFGSNSYWFRFSIVGRIGRCRRQRSLQRGTFATVFLQVKANKMYDSFVAFAIAPFHVPLFFTSFGGNGTRTSRPPTDDKVVESNHYFFCLHRESRFKCNRVQSLSHRTWMPLFRINYFHLSLPIKINALAWGEKNRTHSTLGVSSSPDAKKLTRTVQ